MRPHLASNCLFINCPINSEYMGGWLVGFLFKILGGGVQKQNSVFVPKIIALWKHSPSEFTVSIHNIIKYNMMFFFLQ